MFRNRKRRFDQMPHLTCRPGRPSSFYRNGSAAGGLRPVRDGFTIVEIIIVVVIISIAALAAVPMFSSAGSIQLRAAANMILGDLEYAKSMAISRGQNYSVEFDINNESYSIKDQNGTVIEHPVTRKLYVISFKIDRRLDQVDINSANFNAASSVMFDCLGSPDNGGTVVLQAGGNSSTVRVEPVTGFITIE